MISEQDVTRLFRSFSVYPLGLTEDEIKIRRKNTQLYRGIEGLLDCKRHLAVFNMFKAIPKYCFNCYKVLVSPRDVVELFKLLLIFDEIRLPNDRVRKCMVEERRYCSGTYKGYVYCNSLAEAEELQKLVRLSVSEGISPEVTVTITHGCSEYSLAYPEYAHKGTGVVTMHYKEEWQAHEDYFDSHFVGHKIPADPSDDLPASFDGSPASYKRWEVFCMQYWLRYAATIGDNSYLAITGSELAPLPYLKRPPYEKPATVKSNI